MRHIYSAVMLRKAVPALHAVSQRYPLRRYVGIPYDGTDFISTQLLKSVSLTGFGCLCSIALMPVSFIKEIAYLEYLFILPLLHGKAALTYQLAALLKYDRPCTKAPFPVPCYLAVQPLFGLIIASGTLIGIHGLLILNDSTQSFKIIPCKLPHI